MRVQFAKYGKIAKRNSKIAALSEQKSPEARKARRQMDTFKIRSGRTNVNGFFGVEKIKCKVKKKSRGVKLSPQMRLAMAGKL